MRWCGSMSQYGVCTLCCAEFCTAHSAHALQRAMCKMLNGTSIWAYNTRSFSNFLEIIHGFKKYEQKLSEFASCVTFCGHFLNCLFYYTHMCRWMEWKPDLLSTRLVLFTRRQEQRKFWKYTSYQT